ncbi:OmpA family protein [Pseudofulvibacter geojedonensis]|uniref:OmpA family protein n=1 Tax=Pseudofulvibacter geojedonensis TaxID=1123758 RepID=A0ABW3I473_9FLAO
MKHFYVCLFLLVSSISLAQKQHRDINVYFDTAIYTLNDKEKSALKNFIENLGQEKIIEITMYGYTDDRGSDEYNMNLSIKRAKHVKNELIRLGVNESLFKIVKGKGEVVIRKFDEVETDIIRGLNRKVTVDIKTIIPKPKVNETLIQNKLVEPFNIGDRFVLENIHFQEGYAWITEKSFPHLRKLAQILTDNPELYIEIQGHVCCTRYGRDAIDRKTKKQNLSHTRAKAVYSYLRRKGIAKDRMRYKGMRRTVPLGKGAEYDRRVEIIIKNIVKNRRYKANY